MPCFSRIQQRTQRQRHAKTAPTIGYQRADIVHAYHPATNGQFGRRHRLPSQVADIEPLGRLLGEQTTGGQVEILDGTGIGWTPVGAAPFLS